MAVLAQLFSLGNIASDNTNVRPSALLLILFEALHGGDIRGG